MRAGPRRARFLGPPPAERPRILLGRPLARRLLSALLALALLGALDAFWLEPRRLLFRTEARLDIGLEGLAGSPPLRVVHLSDLHVSRETPLLRRLVEEVATARPDFIVISGDLIRDTPEPVPFARHTAALAAVIAELRAIAPVYAVQGHSEHQGRVITALADAGITWLSNAGRRVGPGGRVLLLGLNQQVGTDELLSGWPNPFGPQRQGGTWTWGAERGFPYRNFYLHYDPRGIAAPADLLDDKGPLAWSSYDLGCDVWIESEDTAVGVTVHSRFVLGEDRMIRLIRDRPDRASPRGFFLTALGTGLAGDLATDVEPEPGRWYRLRVRTETLPDRVQVRAKVWPAAKPEPSEWQATGEDRSRHRLEAGTVGLWAAGGGKALYRNLRVEAPGGRLLLARPLTGRKKPRGFREGARATRLVLALARSPAVPEGTPRIVLAHTPEPVLEAARRGLDAVLAGHTHGGQVRLPFLGALTTRSRLGPYYDRGLFAFAAPNARGWTWLYVQPGVGTSLLPMRFDCPPSWTLLEMGGGAGAMTGVR